jgi:hypothetical protein
MVRPSTPGATARNRDFELGRSMACSGYGNLIGCSIPWVRALLQRGFPEDVPQLPIGGAPSHVLQATIMNSSIERRAQSAASKILSRAIWFQIVSDR